MRIGAIGGYGDIAVRPFNYSIQNKSDVSDAYTESVDEASKAGTPKELSAVQPVRYPNAQIQAEGVEPTKRMENAKKASQEYNQVAANFAGSSTWYGANAVAGGYATVGNNIDLFA